MLDTYLLYLELGWIQLYLTVSVTRAGHLLHYLLTVSGAVSVNVADTLHLSVSVDPNHCI